MSIGVSFSTDFQSRNEHSGGHGITGHGPQGAIIEVSPTPGQYLSTIFLVTKKYGGMRTVINLKYHLVRYEHFQMQGLGSLLNSLVAKLDLKDAYFTLPIQQKDRKYNRFRRKGKLFQFQILPFGLSSAPWVFTRVMKAPMTFLRRHAFKSVVYLDDISLVNLQGQARPKTLATAWLLDHPGFIISWKKSSEHPSQKVEFLGFIVHTVNLLVTLPQVKVDKVISICTDLLERKGCTLRTLASLISKLQNASTAILPALLHFRMMQMANIRALAREQQNYAANLILPESALSEMRWWVRNLSTWNGKSFLNPDPELDIVITSDASLLGWDVECLGQTAQGCRSQIEMLQHINVLEMRAAELASRTCGRAVVFDYDWTTWQLSHRLWKWGRPHRKGVWWWPKEYGSLSYCTGAWLLLSIFRANWTQSWTHRVGSSKTAANWKQCPQIFQGLQKMFPWIEVDIFADRLNHQVPRCWSWRPDPLAEGVDTLTVVCRDMRAYAFPPFKLIHRVLRKVHSEGDTLLLIAPVWCQQPWYSMLLRMLIEQPGLIPSSLLLLTAPDWSPHVSEPVAGPSGLVSLRGSDKGPELSADARDLVAKARSSGTTRALAFILSLFLRNFGNMFWIICSFLFWPQWSG